MPCKRPAWTCWPSPAQTLPQCATASSNYPCSQERLARGAQLTFVEAIFSFVFGDGDPNKGYEASRWAALGQLIQDRWGCLGSRLYCALPVQYQLVVRELSVMPSCFAERAGQLVALTGVWGGGALLAVPGLPAGRALVDTTT